MSISQVSLSVYYIDGEQHLVLKCLLRTLMFLPRAQTDNGSNH